MGTYKRLKGRKNYKCDFNDILRACIYNVERLESDALEVVTICHHVFISTNVFNESFNYKLTCIQESAAKVLKARERGDDC